MYSDYQGVNDEKFDVFRYCRLCLESRVMWSTEFLDGLQDLRVFMNYLHARKTWDKIDEITRNGGKVSNEEMGRMLNEGYV